MRVTAGSDCASGVKVETRISAKLVAVDVAQVLDAGQHRDFAASFILADFVHPDPDSKTI
jgi:hypothetical protein